MAQLNGCVAAEPPFGPGLGASIPACFAPSVIAANPVKPCDRGIFQALDSLLKQSRKRRAGVALSRLPAGFE